MDKTYEKFLRSGMDLAAVGIECCRENTQYFCTPKGASVFGWAGTDGIHFASFAVLAEWFFLLIQ